LASSLFLCTFASASEKKHLGAREDGQHLASEPLIMHRQTQNWFLLKSEQQTDYAVSYTLPAVFQFVQHDLWKK
jgi:hypothetical protein